MIHHYTRILLFLLFATGLQAQTTVTGLVTDGRDGEPLIGVTIVVSGTTTGAATDLDGRYAIRAAESDTLVFSYTGYAPHYELVGNRREIDVALSEDAELLSEIVVTGYGTQRKSDLTGAVSSVKAEEIQRIPTASVAQALQGKVAGVQITPGSGEPGAGAVIRIRGVGTLGNASPLFVVDGMLLDDINFLNPNDVASVEVLKDASATAIYGSRGANGVIIITTRSGQGGDAKFEVNSYFGTQQVVRQIDLVNADQFATLANEVAQNEGTGLPFPDTTQIFGEGTNWQDQIFRQAPIQSHQLAVRGGTDRSTYYISGNYFAQDGIVVGSGFKRFDLRINNTYQLNDRVNVGHNIGIIRRELDIAAGVIASAYRADPTVPVFDSLGNFGNTSVRASVANPAAQIAFNNNSGFGNRLVGNAFAEVEIMKGLKIKSNVGLDLESNQNKSFTPEFFVSSIQFNDENRLFLAMNRQSSWLWENTLSYDRSWAKHRLNLLGGITAQEFSFEEFGGSRVGLPGESEELFFLSAGEIEGQTNFNSGFESSILSYLFRANYVYDDRFLFTASMRADGSSKFGENNRFGYFPSVAAGWNLSNEAFLENITSLSRLKIRASWGQIGNEKIGAYAGRAVVTSNLNAVFGTVPALDFGASIITLANPDIRWEETTQLDIGIEFGLFENRLTAELDYYNRLTDGILVAVPIPEYVGSANFPIVNAAEVRNSGFDLTLDWRDRAGKFGYHFGLVASTVNNEVEALGQGNEEIFGGDLGVGGKLGTRTVVGLPIGAFYGYQTDGVFQNAEEIAAGPTSGGEQPGDLRFVDTNRDGVITADDRTYLGSPIPDLVYGFTFGFDVSGFDLAVDFNGVSGNKIINAKRIARFGTYNFETSFLDRWTGEGSSNAEPRVTNGGLNYNVSDRFLEDGSFLRLRNIQVGYTVPTSLSERVRLDKVRIYVTGTNLLTWTDYSGYTPEITSGSVISVGIDTGVYPIAQSIVFGVQVGF